MRVKLNFIKLTILLVFLNSISTTLYAYTKLAAEPFLNKDTGPVQVFGNIIEQKLPEIVAYKANTVGMTLARDISLTQGVRAGLGLSGAVTDIKTTDTLKATTDAQHLQGRVYGRYDEDLFFLEGLLSLANNRYRYIVNLPNTRLSGTNFGFQYNAKLQTGWAIPFHLIDFIPLLSVNYTSLNQKAYTMYAQHIDGTQTTVPIAAHSEASMKGGLGASIAYYGFTRADDMVVNIYFIMLREFKQTNLVMPSQFTDSGAAFWANRDARNTTLLPIKRSSINIGFNCKILLSENTLLSAQYNAELQKSYNSHSLFGKFTWAF